MASLIDAAGRPLKGKVAPGKTDGPQQPKKTGAGAALVKDASLETFAADVLEASMEVPVIVDFWAPWCGPCKGFAPVFEAASEKHSDVVFGKVNTEDEQELAASFNIRSIPTLMLFREKVILFSQAGALPGSALEQIISKGRELDMAAVRKEIAERETAAPGQTGA